MDKKTITKILRSCPEISEIQIEGLVDKIYSTFEGKHVLRSTLVREQNENKKLLRQILILTKEVVTDVELEQQRMLKSMYQQRVKDEEYLKVLLSSLLRNPTKQGELDLGLEQPELPPSPKKFQHKVVPIPVQSPQQIAERLDITDQDGWELVTCINTNISTAFIFRRPWN
jgi:hypothetical protein